MGIGIRHVVWTSAALALGTFIYVVTLEPMDETANPRAAAIDHAPSRQNLIDNIRSSLAQGQLTAAERQSRGMIESHPEDLAAFFYRALVLRTMGDQEGAAAFWEGLFNLTNGLQGWDNRYTMYQISYYHAWSQAGLGRLDEARGLFERLADLIEENSTDDRGRINSARVQYNLACYRAMAGELGVAMGHWETAVELGIHHHIEPGWWLVDPDLEEMREREEFWAIEARISTGERDHERRDPRGLEPGVDPLADPGADAGVETTP